jgi:hypothetical protein
LAPSGAILASVLAGRDQRGQAAVEYVALVAIVAVVLLSAVALTEGGVADRLLAGIHRGLCAVTGERCPRPGTDRFVLRPCPVARRERRERLGETIASVKLGSSGTLAIVRRSDGSASVTLADGSTAGIEGELGAHIGVGRMRLGADARGSGGVTWSAGRTWDFASVAAARHFAARFGSKATIGGKLADNVRSVCSFLCALVGWNPHARPPKPDEVFTEGGPTASLAATLGEGAANLDASAVLGRRRLRNGETTWYLRLAGAGSGALAPPLNALALHAGGNAVLAYRLDPAGHPLDLTVSAAAEGSAGIALAAGGEGAAGVTAHVGAALAGRGGLIEADARLDLVDPANRAAARRLLASLTDPGSLPDAPVATTALANRVAQQATIDLRAYALQAAASGIDAAVGLGIEVGGGFERSTRGATLVDALTRLPGMPFLPRSDCAQG